VETTRNRLNPFLTYKGIRLNGKFIQRNELKSYPAENAFERDILDYCVELFDQNESTRVQTSGSTGPRKNLTFQKTSIVKSAEATNAFFKLGKNTRALLALPIAYVAGKLMIARAIVGQYELISTEPSSNPLKALSSLVDFAPLTPHQLENGLAESAEKLDLVKTILLGGGPVSYDLKAGIAGLKVKCYQGFGMAETLTHIAIKELNADDSRYVKLPDVGLSLDERGCLNINRPGITDGIIQTNDLVELWDDEFEWLGRIDNLINSGGIKIIPEEVEIHLASSIQANYFVGGIPDEKFGEVVCLFIEGDQDVNLQNITFDSKYQRPKRIIRMDSFIYTESGKIKRKETMEKGLPSAD